MNSREHRGKQRGVGAAMAAMGGVLAAGSCCLPIGTLIAAAGTAGASAFLDTARGWLMPIAAILVTYGFYQLYSPRVRRPLWSQAVLWTSAILVAGLILFPARIAILVARLSRT